MTLEVSQMAKKGPNEVRHLDERLTWTARAQIAK